MQFSKMQVNALTAAIWLFGFAVLLATRLWWPGLCFLLAGTLALYSLTGYGSASTTQGALFCLGLGVWALFRFSVVALFVLLGLAVLAYAFSNPGWPGKKPYVDNRLE